jgi:hypothetical protein
MIRYFEVLAIFQNISQLNKNEIPEKYHNWTVFHYFLRKLYSSMSDEQIDVFIEQNRNDRLSYKERNTFEKTLQTINPNIDRNLLEKLLDDTSRILSEDNPIWIIAEIIKANYGDTIRLDYLIAYFSGKVK